MTKLAIYVCDACKVKFGPRDDKDRILEVGGAHGFFVRTIMNPETKSLENKMMQYDFDFCPKCNKKLMGFVMKELGVK